MPGETYPLNLSQPYPVGQWWIGAYSSEVGRHLLQRRILDQPIMMYRTESGEAVALAGLCPHRLIDNLLDLSHISFVHSTSIPGGGAVVRLPCEISETDRSLFVQRVGRKLPSNPHYRFLFPSYHGAVDQQFDTEFYGPNLIRTGGAIYAKFSHR